MYLAKLFVLCALFYITSAHYYFYRYSSRCRCSSISGGHFWPRTSLVYHGRSIYYRCNSGFKLIGSPRLQCWYGKWNHALPKCVRRYGDNDDDDKETRPCRRFYIYRSICNPDKRYYQHGESVTYRCAEGYVLSTNVATLTCRNGRWDRYPPRCYRRRNDDDDDDDDERRRCRGPGEIQNGSFRPNKDFYGVGEKVWFSCSDGFNLAGTKDLTCQSNGRFSAEFPVCNRPGCQPPRERPNITFEPVKDSYVEDDGLWFNCANDQLYTLIGEQDVYCLANGEWSHDFPVCQENPKCRPPHQPRNGKFYPVRDSYNIGDPVTFECDNGRKLQGEEVLVCLPNGWSSKEPTCH